MRFATLVNLALSIGGLLIALLVVCAWMLARPASRAARTCLLFVTLAYTLTCTYVVPHTVAQILGSGFVPLARSDVPPGSTAVVLLGSGSFTEYDWANNRTAVLDPYGLSRALEAARVYRLIEPAWVICSGGFIDPGNPDAPLAETMKETLVRLGVPAARIIAKDGSTDTHDESLMTRALMPSLHVDHVVLVTSRFHIRRAVSVFRAAGIDVIPAPARDDGPREQPWTVWLVPGTRGMQEAVIIGHEVIGLVYYRLKGWI